MALKTLEEFNKERHEAINKEKQSARNGIACPVCGDELIDSNPDVILTSYPPQKNVSCNSCGYRGYRLA